jgi:hypothetical protein
MNDRHVWLLDVDGTVNAERVDRSVWPAWTVQDVWLRGAFRFEVRIADGVLEFLARVHDEGYAEIRWCTTWGESAALDLAPAFDLPLWSVTKVGSFADKRRAAHAVVHDEGRRLLWTDDEIVGIEPWQGSTFIRPDSKTGLSPSDLGLIARTLGMG